MSRGIIQNAIENKIVIMGVELRDFANFGSECESEEPTLADLTLPGTGRSISNNPDCLRREFVANGKR